MMENSTAIVSNRSAVIVATIILIFAIGVLVAAYDFPGGSGVFPRFAGWVFVGLTALELIIQLKALLAARVVGTTSGPLLSEGVRKEIKGFVWIGFFLIVLYLVGFMIGIPLYIFAFLRLSAGRSYKECAIMAGAATVFVYILFMELLEYRLYAGVLFGA